MEYAQMKHSFDTHKYIKALVAQGLQEAQAETIVSTIVESKEFDLSKLVTKEQFSEFSNYSKNQLSLLQKEIDLLRKDMEHIKENMVTKAVFMEEISKIRTNVTEENSKLRTDNHRWMISMLLAIIGMIITMILKS